MIRLALSSWFVCSVSIVGGRSSSVWMNRAVPFNSGNFSSDSFWSPSTMTGVLFANAERAVVLLGENTSFVFMMRHAPACFINKTISKSLGGTLEFSSSGPAIFSVMSGCLPKVSCSFCASSMCLVCGDT